MNGVHVTDDLLIASEHASLPPSSVPYAATIMINNPEEIKVEDSEDTVMDEAAAPIDEKIVKPEYLPVSIQNESPSQDQQNTSVITKDDTTMSSTEPIQAEAFQKVNEPVSEDALDAAISGKKADGYESSDIDLSSDEEDEDSDTSSTSSSSDEEDGEEAQQPADDEPVDLSEDEGGPASNAVVKTAHEIINIQVEKPKYELTPQTEIIFAGRVFQMIDNVIVVQSRPQSEHTTLDQGSLLVYEDKTILGEIFETFGPVKRPYYSIRFNTVEEREKEPCKRDDPVYYVPTYEKTRIVELEKLKQIKGSDASNMYDEEPDADEMDFSDDEKEREFKAKLKREKNKKKKARRPPVIPQIQHYDHDRGSAAADFGGSLPAREQRSYADLLDEYDSFSNQPPPNPNQVQQQYNSSPVEPQQPVQHQSTPQQPTPQQSIHQQALQQQYQRTGEQLKRAEDILAALFGPKDSSSKN